MAIARYPVAVLDCPDARSLAGFYAAVLDWTLVEGEGGLWFVRAEHGDAIGFQPVEDYRAPLWPTPERPQQAHLDLSVDDLDEAEAAVLELGATKHPEQPGTTFRVFLDPAGHPFCLCA